MEQQRRDDMRIQRRRERDEARRRKLLNAKTRLMGVDRNYLDQQVEALKIKKEIEKQSDMAYANQMKDIKHILEGRNLQEEQAKIEESLQTRNVWDVQRQQSTERSTFDLNDPNELKKRPKWSDDDVVGPASMRCFAGEDRHVGDRRKMQAAQMKDWCAQMQAEKLQVKQRKDEEMLKHSQYLMDVDAVRNEMNKIEMEQRMADNYSVAETNQQLAQMRQAERRQEVALQKQLNEIHNKSIENDPMMRESRDQAISTVPGRVRRDHWKGMTVSQLQGIQAENYENILAKQARQAAEAAEEVKNGCWSSLFFFFFFFFFDRVDLTLTDSSLILFFYCLLNCSSRLTELKLLIPWLTFYNKDTMLNRPKEWRKQCNTNWTKPYKFMKK